LILKLIETKILKLFKHFVSGKYLTALGPQGIVTVRSKCVTKDQLFMLDPNHVQVSLVGHNGKFVSVKQSLDVSANQVELADSETFQLEEDLASQNWTFKTNKNMYWRLENANGLQAVAESVYVLDILLEYSIFLA
jgi:hypothetical protein